MDISSLAAPATGGPLAWVAFLGVVLVLLALDLGVFHRKAHAVGLREAAVWSTVWVLLAATFGGFVAFTYGRGPALEFAAGYLLEKALSVDNIFVFVVLFAYFGIPAQQQHRVLFWGIVGALVLRAVFVLAGGAFLDRFHWAIYIFGALLVITGVKLLLQRVDSGDPGKSPVVRLARRFLPLKEDARCESFFVRENGRVFATPLFLALLAVEFTDVVFAIDSIPAVFAVTRDPFIVFTSNIFAILGLRSLYFLLAGVVGRFHHLKTGLAAILVFVGLKMALADVVRVPIGVSLAVIASTIAVAIAASLVFPKRPAARGEDHTRPVEPGAA